MNRSTALLLIAITLVGFGGRFKLPDVQITQSIVLKCHDVSVDSAHDLVASFATEEVCLPARQIVEIDVEVTVSIVAPNHRRAAVRSSVGFQLVWRGDTACLRERQCRYGREHPRAERVEHA